MPPYKTFHFKSLTSTQDKAKEFAKKGLSNIVVVADKQTQGRGRFRRKWHSSKGGLWISILLKPGNIENIQYLTFAAAIAVVKSIKKIAKVNTKIKWPNDVHYEGKKLCGILTEGFFGKDSHVIIGIGLNLSQNGFPDDIKETATSLKFITQKNFSREIFLNCISEKFFALCEKFFNCKNSDGILKLWKRYCDTIGKEMTVSAKTGTFLGKAVGVDSDCNLLLKLKGGTIKKIVEGDITVRCLQL